VGTAALPVQPSEASVVFAESGSEAAAVLLDADRKPPRFCGQACPELARRECPRHKNDRARAS